MRIKLSLLIICLLMAFTALQAQKELINAGPMLGYAEMQEVMVWIQTTEKARVAIEYWDQDAPTERMNTLDHETLAREAFTAHFILAPLQPGHHYGYRPLINGTPVDFSYALEFKTLPIWKWRGDAPDFDFAVGSCAYINQEGFDRPGTPYGGHYEIFTSIYEKHPDFMLWTGDNIYFREPDWNSRTGILARYTHDRSLPELQPLLATVNHYATWDDHDYGPNDSDRGFWNKETTLEAFKLFWANPSYGMKDMPGAITYFNWNDADFFLLDDRYYRAPDKLAGEGKTELGEKQLQWMKDNLAYSSATFKFVVLGGQFLNTEKEYETYSNFGFDQERQDIINFIYQNNIRGVIFITGDRHYSELSKLEKPGRPVIYDLTVSPFTAGPNVNGKEVNNTLRVPGKVYTDRNFGILNVTGTIQDRKIDITIYNTDGDEQWSYQIRAAEWYAE